MSDLVAVAAGLLALAVVLLLGAIGRPRVRRSPVPAPTDGATAPTGRRRPVRRTTLVVVGALVAGVATAAVGPFAVVLVAASVTIVHRRRRLAVARTRGRAVEAAMPSAVELLLLCVHAGCSPSQAIVATAARAPPAVRDVFTDVELAVHRGRSLAEALDALRGTGPLGRDVADAITAADRDGGPLGPVLDRLAADARTARRRLAEAEVRRLPVRLTFPLVVCTLPAFVLLAIAPAVLGALSTLRATA